MDRYDVIVIGAGPAGLTAGLYAGRAGLNTLILEKLSLGGRILLTEKIENFPGVGREILSFQLVKNMEEQIKQFSNVKVLFEDAKSVNFKTMQIFTEGNRYTASGIIIATGAREKKLNVKGEIEFLAKGVSYCAICDGPLYKDKEVAVIGGGNSALEEAIYLSRLCKKVKLIHRRNVFRASKVLQERLFKIPNIQTILDSVVLEIKGTKTVEGLLIKNLVSGKQDFIECSGVFIYVGIQPNTDFLKGLLEMDESGFIITDDKMSTSKEAVFACGDCRKKSLYQIITACSEGAIAVNSFCDFLLKK
jgi:thioredoxin reductase (NADPH)